MTASADKVTYSANAWGTTVSAAGPLLNSGKTANVPLSCTQKPGVTRNSNVGGIDIPGLLQVEAAETLAGSREDATGQWSIGRSRLAGVTLLDGEIEVGAVTSQAVVRKNTTGKYVPYTSFSIANLKVAGETIEVGKERQVIGIDGVAEIILNDRNNKSYMHSGSSSATAITVKVLDTGAVIRIGEARAALQGRVVDSLMAGEAFGTKVTVGNTVKSGPTAYQAIPCVGTGGADHTNEVASINLSGIGKVQGIKSTVNGTQEPEARATATNTIAGVELLGGLAEITGITTSVEAWREADGSLGYTPHAEIGAIKVAGIELDIPSTPGASLTLPGVGSLRIMDVQEVANGDGVQVVGARLELLDNQVVQLGQARVVLRPQD